MENPYLIASSAMSASAALLHVGCILFGASWYRFFGAGERMAQLAEAGSWHPTLITAGIIAILSAWSLYAAAGAGIIPALPLLRPVLCLITGLYLLRGAAGLVLALFAPGGNGPAFWWWSSIICIAIGSVHLVGTWRLLSGTTA